MNQQSQIPLFIKYSAMLIGVTFLVHGLMASKPVLVPIVVSILLTLLLSPLTERLQKWRFPNTIACFTSVFLVTIMIVGVGYFFYDQLQSMLSDLPKLEEQTRKTVRDIKELMPESFDIEELGLTPESAAEFLRTNSSYISKNLMSVIENIAILILIPVYVFLMLYYRKFLLIFFKKLFSKQKTNDEIEKITNHIRVVVRSYIVGIFWVILILIVMYSIAFFSLGIEHAFLFAVFAGSLNVIPYIGPLMGSLVPFLFALITKDSLWIGVGVVISSYVIQLIESNFLTPRIVGSKVSMNPLVTLVSLIVGFYIWGIIGMVLFIPLTAILKVVFDNIEDTKHYGYLLGDFKSESKSWFKKSKKIQKND